MKIIPKKNIETFSLPLSIYHSIRIADAIGKDGEEFDVVIGLEKKYAEQLKQLSLSESDIDLQKNTGDKVRFGENKYEDWYAKNRTPFCLIHKQTDALAALVWFGPLPLFKDNNNWHTAGWRSYPPFRGKGVMKNFVSLGMDIYTQKLRDIKPDIKLWIAIKQGNTSSYNLALMLGFQILEEVTDDFSLVMVR